MRGEKVSAETEGRGTGGGGGGGAHISIPCSPVSIVCGSGERN